MGYDRVGNIEEGYQCSQSLHRPACVDRTAPLCASPSGLRVKHVCSSDSFNCLTVKCLSAESTVAAAAHIVSTDKQTASWRLKTKLHTPLKEVYFLVFLALMTQAGWH